MSEVSWRNAAIGAFGGLSMLFAGWMLTEMATERRQMDLQISDNRNRIAVLEESNRNMREALRRVEGMLIDMRREQREAGRK